MKGKLGFVILHYNVVKETMDCIQSIEKNIDTDDYHIIVVDNASPNGSGEKLARQYQSSLKVDVILNLDNLGFAKGNNIGYCYAVSELKCDFVCVLNNDTLLEQTDFYRTILDEYENSHFGVMGPKIVLKNGTTNFLYYPFPEMTYFENELRIHKQEYWEMKWHLNYPIVAGKLMRNKIQSILGIKRESRHKAYQLFESLDERREEVVLHGCCLIFSPVYAKHYEEAFCPDTFLYKEEELLYLRCKNKKLKMVYNPKVVIQHLEDVATNSEKKNRRKKIMFWLENQIASLEVLIEVMRKGEEK